MDPDECLKQIHEAIQRFITANPLGGDELTKEQIAACDIADGFENLDQWLSKGGALPQKWAANRGTIARNA